MNGESTLQAFESADSADDVDFEPSSTEKESANNSDEYGTPRWLIRRLHQVIDFDLDAAAGAEPIEIADHRFTEDDDALSQNWDQDNVDSIYLNPPYSNPEPFLERLVDAVVNGSVSVGVALTKSDTSTGWFHNCITEAKAVCFPDDRISFYQEGVENGSPPFANAISVFGAPSRELLEEISNLGALYSKVTVNAAVEQQRLDDIIPDGGVTATAALPMTGSPTANPGSTVNNQYTLDFVEPYDRLEMEFDTSGLGIPESMPEEVEVMVLEEGKSIEPATGSIILDTIGETPSGEDVCVRIRNSADLASQLEVTVARGMGTWTLATPTSVQKIE